MLGDLKIGFILVLISGLAISTRLAPSLLEKKNDGDPSVGRSILVESSSSPAESTSGALTDIVPDGYSATKETAAVKSEELKLDDAPVLTTAMPSLDETKSTESTETKATSEPKIEGDSSAGMVLPSDDSAKSTPASKEHASAQLETPSPLPLPTDSPKASKEESPPAKKEASTRKSTKSDEVVTEFVPYVEPLDDDKNDSIGKENKSSKSVAAKQEKKSTKKNKVDEESFRTEGEKPRDPSKSSDAWHGKVRSYDAPAQTVSDRKPSSGSGDKSSVEPAHPFFRRYLESKRYFVRSGDTLETIAERLYNDPAKADELLRLNRALLSSPSDLRSGMTLKLP